MNRLSKTIYGLLFCTGLVTLGLGCPPAPILPSPEVPTDINWCAPGCDHLKLLTGRDGNPACEEARVLEMPGGEIVTCEQFCHETMQAGRNLYPSCWVKVTKCEQIEEYRRNPQSCESK